MRNIIFSFKYELVLTKLTSSLVIGAAKRERKALNKEFGTCCVVVSPPEEWINKDLSSNILC